MSSREISVGLLWHGRGPGNLGIGALTVGNLIAARAAAERAGVTPRFTLLEFANDLETPYVEGPDIDAFEITTRSMLSPGGYARTVRGLDCILDIGMGDSFTDIYGAKRFGFLFLSKLIAEGLRVPLLFSPQTIGPFSKQPQTALAAHTMRRAVAVVARDPQSFAAIKKMAPGARAVQSIDVAFRLPFERPPRAADGFDEIGVNISGLLFNGGYTGANEFGLQVDYAELMRRFVAEMLKRPRTRVHLISHVTGNALPMDDDGRVADRLVAEFPGAIRVPNFPSPSAAKSCIAGLDFLVAGRMHACIAAYSSGVAVAPVAYSRKFSGLFQGVLGYEYGVPVSGMSTDEALAYLIGCVNERAPLQEAVAAGQAVVADALKAYDDELVALFTAVAERKQT
ncbi:MAG: polysaccharide pyruvyl transferase family protein [Caulobacterales bacterium]|nr:polysaccharide pyruvyl transferase family protein [Caulobacterales bacterium]